MNTMIMNTMIIKYCKSGNFYIAYSEGLGGPIVTGKTKEEVISKYKSLKPIMDFITLVELEKQQRLN